MAAMSLRAVVGLQGSCNTLHCHTWRQLQRETEGTERVDRDAVELTGAAFSACTQPARECDADRTPAGLMMRRYIALSAFTKELNRSPLQHP